MAADADAFDGWPSWEGLQATVWNTSFWRRLRAALQLLVGLAVLVALMAGTPVLLMQWGGWPLDGLPVWDLIRDLPLTPATDQLILALVGITAWGGWALFVLGVCGQVLARARRRRGPPARHAATDQQGRPLAQRLVALVASSLTTLRTPARPRPPATGAEAGTKTPERPVVIEGPLTDLWKLVGVGDDPDATRTDGSDTPDAAKDEDDGAGEPDGAVPPPDSDDGSTQPATAAGDADADADASSEADADGDGDGPSSDRTTEPDGATPTPAPADEATTSSPEGREDPPTRTTTAVVSSAGHLTLSPWRIGVGTRWSGTRLKVVQTGLHVDIYDPENRLVRSLDIDPERRYQGSGTAPGPQPRQSPPNSAASE